MSAASALPVACVIGDPIAHSRSPLVHGHWLAEMAIAGRYERRHVLADDLSGFLRDLAGHGYVGCNVTLPHKEAAFRLVDEATELARALGAVNTIWLDARGRLNGDNTDVHGFLANLDHEAPGWRGTTKTALILGAGGSTRAVLAGLVSSGTPRIVIANRTLERARNLASSQPAGASRIEAIGLDRLPDMLGEADLLVNTTSLGMAGQPEHEFDLGKVKAEALVTDIVYVPLETPLLREARRLGRKTVGGLGMLLHQAVPGFEHWFGRRPRVTDALYRLVAADIAAARD